ncbi:MAG: polymer-forming cytoskeletal protein [Spirochaetaceae bacterium]
MKKNLKQLLLLIAMLTCVSSLFANGQNETDALTTASIVNNGKSLAKAMSDKGFWLAATLKDVEVSKDFVVEGEFVHKEKIDRKLALYAQDEDHKITAQFTLTAPKMIVRSENFRITGGTFKGDVYVEAMGFKLDKSSTVDGDIYFKTQEMMDSFTMHETATFNGKKSVK